MVGRVVLLGVVVVQVQVLAGTGLMGLRNPALVQCNLAPAPADDGSLAPADDGSETALVAPTEELLEKNLALGLHVGFLACLSLGLGWLWPGLDWLWLG